MTMIFDSLSADINQNLERIERLMEQVRNTSSHVAHELRTPLTHLQNRLFNLTERAGLDNDVRDELNLAVDEVHKILGLFRTVMRIGEIESGRCVHQFENIEARQLLEEIAEYYQPLAEERGCRLKIEIKAGIQLFGDRALLFQALANLVENALKYAAQGKFITLSVTLYRGWIALSVADRGPGIRPRFIPKRYSVFSGWIPGFSPAMGWDCLWFRRLPTCTVANSIWTPLSRA
nr:HAMP domain-containing sensor histidine kinase [Pectobacterium colocasium]